MANGKTKKSEKIGVCFTTQTALYESADMDALPKSYTSSQSDNGKLRNRVFIDNTKSH